MLTLLSLGPGGQAAGSSRLRSSPSRMDEDLSEFREKASVSASCTCRERRQRRVPPGAGMGQSGPPERCRAVVREDQRSEHRQHVHLVQEPSLGRGWEMTRGCHSQQSATPGLGWRAGELP